MVPSALIQPKCLFGNSVQPFVLVVVLVLVLDLTRVFEDEEDDENEEDAAGPSFQTDSKAELLEKVLRCWVRVCQTLVVLSPVLAEQGRAGFDGMNFSLDKTFDGLDTPAKRWKAIITCIVDNIIAWYHQDIFSKKMGALFSNYVQGHQAELGELLVLLVMAKQRPPGWEKEIERFIVREQKNSFPLNKVFVALQQEFKVSFSTERTRQQLQHLAAMAIAKHATGAKHPNTKLIEKVAKQVFDEPEAR